MFVYAENYAGKGSNKVISCLDFYIRSLLSETIKLHIFPDNCFSQNKNRYIIVYLCAIANSKLDEFHVFYPLPGHCRMACDRDFVEFKKRGERRTKLPFPLNGLN